MPEDLPGSDHLGPTALEVDDLLALVAAYNPRSDAELIRRAWDYGARMHEGQARRSGEPYWTHPVAVACLLTEQRLDDATIVTALLHDTLEDTGTTRAELARLFGEDIAGMVDGVTKLTNLELSSTDAAAKQVENFRKLFMAISRDMRVVLVKLADRLHNMRTIGHMPHAKQAQKARETLELYAPLAGRMGMQWMREELEDLAFMVLDPERRESILTRFASLRSKTEDVVGRITADIEAELARAGVRGRVRGRAKRPFSIWRKMEAKEILFSRLSDIYAFRIIVDDVASCYVALGAIHRRWRAVPGRFKDYVSQPKSNGYRSIHTTVSGRDGKRVEVQIRTRAMHEVAERGVAAHWAYRDGVRAENPYTVDPQEWLRELSAQFEDAADPAEFMEVVRVEMRTEQVFCFTPKGDVLAVPRDATALDFAYAVHTDIGHKTVAARIDGKRAPLNTVLANGQTVEIVTAEGQTPQESQLQIARTGRALSAIRRALREERRAGHARLGRELARQAFERMGKRATDKALEAGARAVGAEGVEGMLAAIGAFELRPRAVLDALYPELAHAAPDPDVDPDAAILGLGPDDQFDRAGCCQPLPGERIVGVRHPGRGVIVHAIDCARLADADDDERWLDLHWAPGHHAPRNAVTLAMTISNASGVLGRICTLIGEQNANISDLRFVDRKPDFFRLVMDVEVRDREHLHAVIMAAEADGDVAHIKRRRAEG
jgi:GTP pyrophosphokinase/guanosine-3',5'-bis(diphosphate) 3'-pyrophosphohydrolase